uniref:P53 regulated pa26 nuclear protein sestrin n=2 Tax=Ornithodoros turicata TaxID=34597 RepID=A0A2R5LC95_9ACAR
MILPSRKESPLQERNNTMGQMGIRNTQVLFIDALCQSSHLDLLMAYHPAYQAPFLRTQNFILKSDGPLPYDQRHYIAIMAAARHNCSYLVNQQKEAFLSPDVSGDKAWLQGLHCIPKKLRDLDEINKILAHRPWLITREHIERLTKGKNNWSLSEVVQAIVILAHFHALSSFVFGCGINSEVEESNGQKASNNGYSANGEGEVSSLKRSAQSSVETLMRKMKNMSQHRVDDDASMEERVRCFETECNGASYTSSSQCNPVTDLSQFVTDPTFGYQDFARREDVEIPTFRVQDYSWEDHGYSLVNRLYNDVGELLNEKFKVAYNLTYYTMGGKTEVDTSMFRQAVWNYIQCIYGIRHDDYDYREVNELLDRELKEYIKAVCCYPDRMAKGNYDSVMRDFKYSEKVHVTIMILEARMQAELLYALRALMRYMT